MQALPTHYKSLSILWILFGVLCALQAAWLVVNRSVLRLMFGALLVRVPNPDPWMSLCTVLLVGATILAAVTTIFSLLGAMTLMRPNRSNRTFPIVAAVLGLMAGPLGTALGVYTLVVWLPAAGRAYARPAAA
jgi:hypothetical protein